MFYNEARKVSGGGNMFEPRKLALGQIFETPREGEGLSYLQVPLFQRRYVWEKEQEVLRLIEDVFENLGNLYFMGPIILCLPKDSREAIEIVDGQQRLITFALFFRVLVDYIQMRRAEEGSFPGKLNEQSDSLAQKARARIIKGVKVERPSLKLGKLLDGFFRMNIILTDDLNKIEAMRQKAAKGEIQAISRLRAAYLKIFDSLCELCAGLKGEALFSKLQNIVDSLIYKQLFLVITLENESDAYTVFETMNERAKPLNTSDLVKNLLFRKLNTFSNEEDILNQLEDLWDTIEEQVSNFGSFLWHAWVSRYGECHRSRLFRKIEKQVDDFMNETMIFDFVGDVIYEEAPWYHDYENPGEILEYEDEATKDRRRYLKMLKIMNASRCYPLLLSIDYATKKRRVINQEKANELLNILTSLTFWHSGICEKDAKRLQTKYHKLAKEVRGMANNGEINTASIKSELMSEFPSEDECSSSFKSKKYTKASFAKMVLRNIEEKYEEGGEKALKEDSVVWLEHILPQKPTKESPWLTLFPDKGERESYCARFGNQTLLDKRLDIAASNKTFEEKKEKYCKSKVKITNELVGKYKEWTKETINDRTEWLFNLSQKIWPIYSE